MATKKKNGTKAASKKITAKKAPAPKQAKAPKLPNPKAVEKVRAEVKPKERDPRLPEVGTTIEKTDREGKVRCSCTVKEDGIHYDGRVFSSLSGAAMAAATDLGLKNKTQNGFVFWGLSKPPRPISDPIEAFEAAWERFHGRVKAIAESCPEDKRADLAGAIEKATKALAKS